MLTAVRFVLDALVYINALEIFIPLEAVLALARILRNFGNLFSVIIVVVVVVVVIVVLVVVYALTVVIFFSKDLRYHVWMYCSTYTLVRSHCILALGVFRTNLRHSFAFVNVLTSLPIVS